MINEPECKDGNERAYVGTWEWNDFTIHLWYADTFIECGILKDYLYYEFYDKGEMIFSGDKYSPCILYGIGSDNTYINLLGFLTLQESDTDQEYFEKHTSRQLEWIYTDRCEELRLFVYDFESPERAELSQ